MACDGISQMVYKIGENKPARVHMSGCRGCPLLQCFVRGADHCWFWILLEMMIVKDGDTVIGSSTYKDEWAPATFSETR